MIRDEWVGHGGRVRLILGDCREVLPTLTGIDAVVSDPPYGMDIGRRSGVGRDRMCAARNDYSVVGDDVPFDPSPWLSFRIVVLFGANHYAHRLPASRGWIVWDKRDGVPPNDQADCELAWTNQDRAERVYSHLWNGMIKASERGIARVHPTQKPVALMRWVLESVRVPVNALVLDPYMGSGTTGVACLATGRRFVGIEIDEGHFRTARDRIANETPPLFGATA